jgi:peroxiredoxin
MLLYKKYFLAIFLMIFFLHSKIVAKDSITVYLFLLDKCRICQELSPELNTLYSEFNKDFTFIGIFPNFISKENDILAFVEKYNIEFKTKTDYFKKLTNKLNATITPEVVVYNETKNKILYRGAINDLFHSPGKRRHHIPNQYLRRALEDIRLGQNIQNQETTPIGCFINLNDFIDN